MMSGSPGDAGLPPTASAAGHRVIGAKHVRDGRPCQDDVRVVQHDDCVVLAVADGHGSSRHAEVGAKLAVEVAVSTLAEFVASVGPEHRGDARAVHAFAQHPLRVQVVREWASRVRELAGNDHVELKDYGSTLLFVVATPDFLLLGQLGDGDILVVDAFGAVSRPLPTDPSSFAEETLSLCLPEAWSSLRVRVTPRPTAETLVLVSTDGYSKSYATDVDFERIGPDYLAMVREDGVAGVAQHLEEFLTAVTRGGSGDDVALGLIYLPAAPLHRELAAPAADEPSSPSPPPEEAVVGPPAADAAAQNTTVRDPGEME